MPTAIVTGISQGLGHAVTDLLTKVGWHVVGDARNAQRLAAAVTGFHHPDRVTAVAGDVSDDGHRRTLVNEARRHGDLSLLVHNASELGPSPLPALCDYPLDVLEDVYRTNVIAAVALTQLAAPTLDAANAPTVVMISSDAAVEAYPTWGGYGSSKAALDHVAAVLAVERLQWRVYAFDPGDMRTDMHQRAFPGEDISDRQEPESVAPLFLRLLEQRPVSGRYRAGDVAGLEAA